MLFNGTAAPLFSPDGSDWWRSRRQGERGAGGGSGGLWGGSRGLVGLERGLQRQRARLLDENGRGDRFICCDENKMSQTGNI